MRETLKLDAKPNATKVSTILETPLSIELGIRLESCSIE